MFQHKILAENIKKYRKAAGLTQSELAEKLFVSAQNVSKWETAKSVPDLEHLCKLSGALAVSVDRLLGAAPQDVRGDVLIAIDGGGTKTEFVLYTEHGELLARVRRGGSNPNSVGMEQTKDVLRSGIDALLVRCPDVSAVYAGIAGCGAEESCKVLRSYLKKNYPGMRVTVKSDMPNVAASATESERCISVICGTGSVVYAKTPDGDHRVGGWGYLFDCGGSGFDLGRDAVRAALGADDGIAPQTMLQDLLRKRLGAGVWERISTLYRMSPSEIASFSGLVFEAYRAGDAVAAQIVRQNMERLAFLIASAASLYDCGTEVVISGGLTAEKAVLEPILRENLPDAFTLLFTEIPQIVGAAVNGLRTHGKYDPAFRETFYESCKKRMEEETDAENGTA